MSKYFVIKRDTCSRCKGLGLEMAMLSIESQTAVMTGQSLIPVDLKPDQKLTDLSCVRCNGVKYIEEQEPLLDVLGRVRWNQLGKYGKNYPPLQFTKLRIVEEDE